MPQIRQRTAARSYANSSVRVGSFRSRCPKQHSSIAISLSSPVEIAMAAAAAAAVPLVTIQMHRRRSCSSLRLIRMERLVLLSSIIIPCHSRPSILVPFQPELVQFLKVYSSLLLLIRIILFFLISRIE